MRSAARRYAAPPTAVISGCASMSYLRHACLAQVRLSVCSTLRSYYDCDGTCTRRCEVGFTLRRRVPCCPGSGHCPTPQAQTLTIPRLRCTVSQFSIWWTCVEKPTSRYVCSGVEIYDKRADGAFIHLDLPRTAPLPTSGCSYSGTA